MPKRVWRNSHLNAGQFSIFTHFLKEINSAERISALIEKQIVALFKFAFVTDFVDIFFDILNSVLSDWDFPLLSALAKDSNDTLI